MSGYSYLYPKEVTAFSTYDLSSRFPFRRGSGEELSPIADNILDCARVFSLQWLRRCHLRISQVHVWLALDVTNRNYVVIGTGSLDGPVLVAKVQEQNADSNPRYVPVDPVRGAKLTRSSNLRPKTRQVQLQSMTNIHMRQHIRALLRGSHRT